MVWFVLPQVHLALSGFRRVGLGVCASRPRRDAHTVYNRPATAAAIAATISPRITSST